MIDYSMNKTLESKTRHKMDCERVFKHYDLSCLRCVELSGGAAPRAGWSDWKREQERRTNLAIDAHFSSEKHKSGGCGVVCTFGDW